MALLTSVMALDTDLKIKGEVSIQAHRLCILIDGLVLVQYTSCDKVYYCFSVVVIVGDSGVGKTNLISRFTKNVFHSESKPTIGVEFDCVGMEIDGRGLKTQLWDTGAKELV